MRAAHGGMGCLPGRLACHEPVSDRIAFGMDYHKIAILFAAFLLAAPACAQQAAPELISGCVPCHGADGIARYGEVPILAGQNAPYVLNQLHAFQSGKRAHKEMRYMTRNLTEAEMEAIAAYFSSLPPR